MVHRSPRHSYRDLRFLIQRSFEGITGFGDRVEVDGKIHRIAEGIWHDNYWFLIRGRDLPSVRTEQAYVLRLLQQQHDWQQGPESHDRLVREAETLRAIDVLRLRSSNSGIRLLRKGPQLRTHRHDRDRPSGRVA